jgi:hypothetical protein
MQELSLGEGHLKRTAMKKTEDVKDCRELNLTQMQEAGRDMYVPGEYQAEALAFLKSCLGEQRYEQIMSPAKARQYPYVAARLFLSPKDWDKYAYVEQHGTLQGFI